MPTFKTVIHPRYLGMGAQGLILGFTVGLTTAAVLLIVRYRRDIRRWKAGIR